MKKKKIDKEERTITVKLDDDAILDDTENLIDRKGKSTDQIINEYVANINKPKSP